ncbi:MAG: hypothetical protein AAGF54_03355 [Pseudomonadota bacterium]
MYPLVKCALNFRNLSVIAVFALTACNSSKDVLGPPVLNGNWASSDGVYVAEFNNGSFRAVANDTGAVISEGRYIALAENKVQIKWNGLVSGTTNEAECIKPEANQMDCVDQNGNRFTLRRSI